MPRSTPECPQRSRSYLEERLGEFHVYGDPSSALPPFRLSPRPVTLPPLLAGRLREIGEDLAAFQRAVAELYRQSERDERLAVVSDYLDRGKGEALLLHGRLKRLRHDLPVLIRPDILVTREGLKVTEMDSVPGGFGTLAALQDVYSDIGYPPLGGSRGVLDAFYEAMASLTGRAEPTVAIAVSDESRDYRPEMEVLASLERGLGRDVTVVHPRDLAFRDDGLLLPDGRRVDALYRFFELFDIRNVPKWELFLYAAKRKTVVLTPPAKPHLEEKLQAALLFLPSLEDDFQKLLGPDRLLRLRGLFPRTWVVDGRPVPPQGEIAGLRLAGRPVRSFLDLKDIAQAERRKWVLKPSGFSPLAWGSHGVHIGEDLSLADWNEAVDRAIEAWEKGDSPWILQSYFKPVVTDATALSDEGEEPFPARVRYSPYYFTAGESLKVAGLLATLCPRDKKIIHGMTDAVMAPAAP